MDYLDLNLITDRHLWGDWVVLERLGGQAAEDGAFATCRQVGFRENGDLVFENGSGEKGSWTLFKEDEIIYNPQLNFTFTANEEVLNAIITRFREDDEEDFISLKVTLYFTSGLDLLLEQKAAKLP